MHNALFRILLIPADLHRRRYSQQRLGIEIHGKKPSRIEHEVHREFEAQLVWIFYLMLLLVAS